jgi:hypothetical protein
MKNMTNTILMLTALTTGTTANAQSFSMTPHIDKIELSTGIKAVPDLNYEPIQYDYKWDNDAPVLVSLGVLAICVTIVVLATTASSSEQADTTRDQYPLTR